jgi:uncharacterized protein YjdB
MPVPSSSSLGPRLVLLVASAGIFDSCGKGSDLTGPPDTPAVATVEVTPSPISLALGQAIQLTATVKAADGSVLTDRIVAWATSDPAIAGIGESGMVTGASAGAATITATSEGQSGSTTVTVTAAAPVASVEVVPNPSSVLLGQTAQLTAVLRAANGDELSGLVAWSSSDDAIASVSETGVMTGVAVGEATITATSEGQSGSSALTVSAVAVATVEVAPPTAAITVSATVQLTAIAKDAGGAVLAGRPAAWTTSDANVARVNPTGRVTGFGAGSATITATIEGKTGSASITVTQQAVATIEVTPDPATVAVQQTIQLTATLKAGDGTELSGRAVTWETSNGAVATVSQSGLVTGVTTGTATITARSEGKSGTSALTVTQTQLPVATVEVTSANDNHVAVNATLQFTATLKAANGTVLTGRSVTWTSSTQAVATVNASGLARGVAPGTATITATSEGKSGSASLTVTPVAGVIRIWRGGAAGRPNDWSAPGNWNPSGKPIALDTVRIPEVANAAVLSENVQIARLHIVGGKLRLAGHQLRVTAPLMPAMISATE